MIAVLVETDAQGATLVSRETLTFARQAADRAGGVPVEAVLVGPVPADLQPTLMGQLGELGVAAVHHAEDERLAAYGGAAWAAAVVDIVKAQSPSMLMAAGTARGNEVMAHVSARLDVDMAANVVELDSVTPCVVTRQVVGGAALEEMRLDGQVAVLSVAGHACDPVAAAEPTTPDVRVFAPTLAEADLVARVARVEAAVADDSSALTGARVVVGAGRGVGSAEGFAELLEMTKLLDGALGVSRVVTSLGWRPHAEQVGQTGSRIAPDLYVPCGISGAIQHWAGCQSAKTILAINTQEDAPMVTKAHYAVIGDLHEVVPAINEELRRRLAQD